MPLRKGTGKATTRKNFEEFGRGKTYRRTKKRFGKRRADKQRIAVVLANKRKSAARKKSHKRKSYRRHKTR
jgi:hypothetical protein